LIWLYIRASRWGQTLDYTTFPEYKSLGRSGNTFVILPSSLRHLPSEEDAFRPRGAAEETLEFPV